MHALRLLPLLLLVKLGRCSWSSTVARGDRYSYILRAKGSSKTCELTLDMNFRVHLRISGRHFRSAIKAGEGVNRLIRERGISINIMNQREERIQRHLIMSRKGASIQC